MTNPQILLFLISVVNIPSGCSPFCFPLKSLSVLFPNSSRSSAQLNNEVLYPEATLGVLQSDADGTIERIEIWLDLRGTTITPKMAIELWQTEVEYGQIEHEYKGRLPKVPFSKCLLPFGESEQIDSPTPFTNGVSECDIDVLMVGQDGHSFKSISDQQSDSVGTIVSLKTSQSTSMPILPDPLSLIDKYSNGGCILFDTKDWKILGEDRKLGMLFQLVEIVGSGDRSVKSGRLGWTCHSKSEIIKSAMWMKCQSDISTKTLESGIVVPDDEVAYGMVLQQEKREKYVIIVPYDSGLLKAATSLIHDIEVSNP